MSNFIHLHNHSDYSLLDGACRISDYIRKAQELNMKHLALTDHGNLFGALEFHNMCRTVDINPVIGSEVYVAPGSRFDKPQSGPRSYHMVLYAKNEKGYKNLIKLTSLGYTEGFYYRPRIDDELLEQYHEGLMASSACLAGEVARKIISGNRNDALNKVCYYRDLFGIDNYFLEIMNHGIPEEEAVREGISWLNKKTGLPVIATNDVHYLDKEHATAQDILICISTGKKRSDKERIKHDAPEYYFKSEEEMRELFPDCPEAIENTLMVAEKCDLEIPQPGPLLPHYEIPEEFPDQVKYLQHLTFKGLNQRYPGVTGNDREKLNARASYELKVLAGMGYEGYFLIVWDFIHWARNNKIPVGPGRGSGAGSIVAYALKITDIDPIKYDLLFERFLNPERISMPDFDIDFCFERRSEVIDYINEKYGHKNVAGICTFGTLKTKAVIKDVARVLDIPFEISNLITNLIPYSGDMNIKTALGSIPKLREYRDQGGVYEELFNVANILEGMHRHFSTHACGRVIGQSELTNFVPIIKDPKSGETITAYNMDMIESCGLVKMDILGLKTLTILYDCEKLIQQKNPEFKLAEIPEDDNPTFKMLSEGKSDAIFQFEGQGMQRVLIEAKPESISDLTALNALYRPGPIQNINQFVESRHGRRKITYPHKDIAEILKTTYGVIVYQEQVMRVAQIIAGFSLAKADILRRAMGKKKVDEMAKMEKDFINGAVKKGYDEGLAKSIFTMLVPFAGYGFNKSHAVAYSLIAYKTAYCKAHYPAEFWASNLSNWMDSFEKMENYIRSARLSNMEILPPDINISRQRFTVSGNSIIYGLMGIKGLGQSAVNNIISERNLNGPYKNFIDFMERNDLKTVNRKAVESCIRTGLFDKIEDKTRSTLMKSLAHTFDIIIRNKRDEISGQGSLFEDSPEEIQANFKWSEAPEWSEQEKLQMEKEYLGLYISGHPMDPARAIWGKYHSLDLSDIPQKKSAARETLVGILKDIRFAVSRNGASMAFCELEDYNGKISLTIFPDTYRKFASLIQDGTIAIVKGKLDLNRTQPQIKVDEIAAIPPQRPTDPPETKQSRDRRIVHIHLENSESPYSSLKNLRQIIEISPGNLPLHIHVYENGIHKEIRTSDKFRVSGEKDFLDSMKTQKIISKVCIE